MSAHYPLQFTLEDGIQVEVNRIESNTFHFILTSDKGTSRHFTFIDDDRAKDEKTAMLDFDQLNAVRAFWLSRHDVV